LGFAVPEIDMVEFYGCEGFPDPGRGDIFYQEVDPVQEAGEVQLPEELVVAEDIGENLKILLNGEEDVDRLNQVQFQKLW
jgi:hypothetical protein